MNSVQSKNPANNLNLAGGFSEIVGKLLQNTEGQLPAEIVSYDRAKNIAKVKILITLLKTDGTPVKRAQVASVPVLALGCGRYVLNFPLRKGDKGWIEASDRDISLFMQSGQRESQPNTLRTHNFSDGRFIPDAFGAYEIAAEDENALVIQTLDGSQRIAIDDTGVRVTATRMDINAELWINGVKFLLHHHGGVTIGGANTAGVTP